MEANFLLFIQEHIRNPITDVLFKGITTLGNAGAFWIAITLLLLCFKKTRKIGIMCAVSLLLSLVINNLMLKNIIARPRPYDMIEGLKTLVAAPTDFSFPSGHTASSFAAATVLFLTLPKKYGIPAIILAALMGFSRLYIGVHYPTDVLAGLISGVLIAIITVKAFKKLCQK
ncbi:MAG: phosphatase PAP2 family protein [Clostridia bacterium]|nr:phosphatase PAP2 family protein [Clostridia bacterium]